MNAPIEFKAVGAHEHYLQAVRAIVVNRFQVNNAEDQKQLDVLRSVKIVYGIGKPGLYGHCFHTAWNKGQPIIEICAYQEEDKYQLAETLIHEMAHAIQELGEGHGKNWKASARLLGLTDPQATKGKGERDRNMAPEIIAEIDKLEDPRTHGAPSFSGIMPKFTGTTGGGCKGGSGTRGGTSRGPGSGSRLRLYVCDCNIKVRVARDVFDARCNLCNSAFKPQVADKR